MSAACLCEDAKDGLLTGLESGEEELDWEGALGIGLCGELCGVFPVEYKPFGKHQSSLC